MSEFTPADIFAGMSSDEMRRRLYRRALCRHRVCKLWSSPKERPPGALPARSGARGEIRAGGRLPARPADNTGGVMNMNGPARSAPVATARGRRKIGQRWPEGMELPPTIC